MSPKANTFGRRLGHGHLNDYRGLWLGSHKVGVYAVRRLGLLTFGKLRVVAHAALQVSALLQDVPPSRNSVLQNNGSVIVSYLIGVEKRRLGSLFVLLLVLHFITITYHSN